MKKPTKEQLDALIMCYQEAVDILRVSNGIVLQIENRGAAEEIELMITDLERSIINIAAMKDNIYPA